jgi:hypothetical protein
VVVVGAPAVGAVVGVVVAGVTGVVPPTDTSLAVDEQAPATSAPLSVTSRAAKILDRATRGC